MSLLLWTSSKSNVTTVDHRYRLPIPILVYCMVCRLDRAALILQYLGDSATQRSALSSRLRTKLQNEGILSLLYLSSGVLPDDILLKIFYHYSTWMLPHHLGLRLPTYAEGGYRLYSSLHHV
jgi:hypothetical protein